MALKTLYLSC